MVYDLEQRRRVKLLRCAEMRSLDVVSLAWSHDSKYILVQGGSPDYQLVYFFWEKGKVITSITRVISQASGGSVGSVSFHPKANLFDNTAGSGQREPPRLVLEVGGTSTLQAAMLGKLKSPLRHGCLQS